MNQPILNREFDNQSIERFEQMFQTGDIDFKYRSRHIDGTVIHYAALSGSQSRIELLLKRGADITIKDAYNRTVLHFAAQSGNLKLVQWLVEQGLNVKKKAELKRTSLHFAAESGNLKLVQWLVDQGLTSTQKTIIKVQSCIAPPKAGI